MTVEGNCTRGLKLKGANNRMDFVHFQGDQIFGHPIAAVDITYVGPTMSERTKSCLHPSASSLRRGSQLRLNLPLVDAW